MTTSSTTVVADPSDEPTPGAGVIAEEPISTTEEPKTDTPSVDNLDPSKSTDTPADDDKSTDKPDAKDDTPTSPKFDEDLDDWAEKTGRPKPTTDTERQAFQDLRDGQREFSRAQEAKKNADALNKVVEETDVDDLDDEEDDEDPVLKEIRELKKDRDEQRTARLQSEFFTENKVSEEQGKTIAEIFDEKMKRETDPKEKLAAFKYWSSPARLPDLLELAQARLGSADAEAAREVAQQEERERIAKESEANSTNRGAKSTVTGEKSDDERRLESFSNW